MARSLIDANDDEDIPESEREWKVARYFAEEGIKVEFVN